MKYLILISAIFLSSSYYNAQENKPKKLSYEQYIIQYGTDDTSIAIIDIFFDKRENSGAGQMSFLPLSSAVIIVSPPVGIGLMAISSPLFVNGLIISNKYSHKNLLKTLISYQNENILSRHNRKMVANLIQIQEDMRIEDLLEARYNAMK